MKNIYKLIKKAKRDWEDSRSSVDIYEFMNHSEEKKYAMSIRGGLERSINGVPLRKILSEELKINIKKDSKYRLLSLSEAKKMDFRNLDDALFWISEIKNMTYDTLFIDK